MDEEQIEMVTKAAYRITKPEIPISLDDIKVKYLFNK